MLNKILETKRQEVEQLKRAGYRYPYTVKERELASYSFLEALLHPNRRSALIAEVKKASPSKGVIREDFHPVEIAKAYEQARADCLSVLTDREYFQGDPSFIAQIKQQVSLPVLRKDFIIDPIQVEESVELGADCILLIAKALPVEQLIELYHLAEEKGLDVLIEIASQEELETLLSKLKPRMIGINNRDLRTFETSPEVTKALLPHIPKDILVISESGINSGKIVKELADLGVGGFLIGEHFMRQDNLMEAVESLYVHL